MLNTIREDAVRIFSTDTDSGSVTVIDRHGVDFRVVGRVDVGNAPRGAVKVTADGRGYVSNCGGDTISEIDIVAGREVTQIKVGPAPRGIGLLPGDRWALVSSSGGNFVSIVDLDRRQEVRRVAVGRDPRHMAVSKDGKATYVAIWGGQHVAHLDTTSLVDSKQPEPDGVREVARIEIGEDAYPYSVTIEPGDKRAFVANTQASYVSVIDLGEDRVTAAIDLGSKGARAIAFSPDGNRAYVSVEDTSEVVIIDPQSLTVVERVAVGPGPRGVAIDPGGGFMYSAAFARTTSGGIDDLAFIANTLTVLDLSVGPIRSSKAYQQVPVGKGPCSVSVVALGRLSRLHLHDLPATVPAKGS